MADWEDSPAHGISESADALAGAPLADNALPAESPAQVPAVAPPDPPEPPTAPVVDEPPFLSRPAEPDAEPDALPDDLRALQESLEQPTGEMRRLDVEAAAAQVHASFESPPWPVAAGAPEPPVVDPEPVAEEPAPGEEANAQPVAAQPEEDAAAAEETTSWETLIAAAAAAADTSSTDVTAVTPAVAESDATAEEMASAQIVDGQDAGSQPPATTEGAVAEDESVAESAVEGEGVEAAAPGAEGEAAAEQPAEGETSLDDIAPGTVAAEAAEQAEEGEQTEEELIAPPVTKVSWWPFVGYVVVWLGAAGYSVYELRNTPIGQGVYETNLYRMSLLGGLGLLAAGPALLLIVWFASWIGRKNRRIGSMFFSALVKGATATLLGAIIWIGAIVLIDYLRFGRPF
jgi:hypothetical protein